MIFEVPAHGEVIGDPLDVHSVNCENSPTQTFQKGWKEDKTLVGSGKDCELDLESCELVGGQSMKLS